MGTDGKKTREHCIGFAFNTAFICFSQSGHGVLWVGVQVVNPDACWFFFWSASPHDFLYIADPAFFVVSHSTNQSFELGLTLLHHLWAHWQ